MLGGLLEGEEPQKAFLREEKQSFPICTGVSTVRICPWVRWRPRIPLKEFSVCVSVYIYILGIFCLLRDLRFVCLEIKSKQLLNRHPIPLGAGGIVWMVAVVAFCPLPCHGGAGFKHLPGIILPPGWGSEMEEGCWVQGRDCDKDGWMRKGVVGLQAPSLPMLKPGCCSAGLVPPDWETG